ncbi:hypothetical protein JCM10207_008756 [Rhodosporidiobolus poonsookiae]
MSEHSTQPLFAERSYHPYSNPPSFQPLPTSHDPSPSLDTAQGYSQWSTDHQGATAAYESYGSRPQDDAASKEATTLATSSRSNGHPPVRGQSRWKAFWATYKTRNQLVFLGLIVFQAVAVLAMVALVYATATGDITTTEILRTDPELQSVATYLSVFILAVVFELLITLDAMQEKNIMSLVVLTAFQVAMLVYSSVLPTQLRNALSGSSADTDSVQRLCHIYTIVIPCVIGATTLAMGGMLWPLYGEFGWATFRELGAGLAITRAYRRYQVFACLLKYDAFAFISFAIQFLVLVSGTPTVEFVLTIVALPVTLVALVLFAIVVRVESRTGVWVSFFVQACGMAYFIWKLYRIYADSSSDRYNSAQATLTIFSVISLVMLCATTAMMGICMLRFGSGLKDRIPGYFSRSSAFKQGGAAAEQETPDRPGLGRNESSRYGGDALRPRMSID